MTLRDKFLNSPCEKGYINMNIYRAENNVKIADDYAIEFAEWLERLKSSEIDTIDYDLYLRYNTEELLEIFKKEKGL